MLTYEKAAPDFHSLFKTHGDNLKDMLSYIKDREKEFNDSNQKDFTAFLFSSTIDQK